MPRWKDQQYRLTLSGDVETGKDPDDAGTFPYTVHQADIALPSCNVLCTVYYNDISCYYTVTALLLKLSITTLCLKKSLHL